MSLGEKRLGDLIDDFCPRCKFLLNHAIASFVNGEVVKVICQTCYTEHPFHRGEDMRKKKLAAKNSPLEQVLAKVAPGSTAEAEGHPNEDAESSPEEATRSPKKKKAAAPARYISRHKGKPPASKS
jgi:DNA-directed RNA polymerase subunit M/transcription elongation factor TFIIS